MAWRDLVTRTATVCTERLGGPVTLRAARTGQTVAVSAIVGREPGELDANGGFELQTVADVATDALGWVPACGDVVTDADGQRYLVDGWHERGGGVTRLVLREDTR